MTTPSVRIIAVHKAYRRGNVLTPVLTGVNLEVAAGECVFLVGPSGSGKSTLLSIIGCILTPDQGLVEIVGQNVLSMADCERTMLRRNRLGFVFQRFQLIRGLTARENVQVPLTLLGSSLRIARRRADELLQAVGIFEQRNSLPQNLSGGQCQRVALARALAVDPELILADEPTASLDAENGQQVMELIRRLTTDEGKTAIVVTHDHRVLRYADRICTMDNGQLVEQPFDQESNKQFQLMTAAQY